MTSTAGLGPGIETCARCGHVAGAVCPTCGAHDPLLGGSIWYEVPPAVGAGASGQTGMGVLRLCHTYVRPGRPSCYTEETRDRSAGAGRWAP